MYGFFVTLFVLICILQTIVILLQSSKGGGLAGAFGGGSMGAMFGSRGAATFLSKLTAGLATAFMVLALILGLLASSGGGQSQGLVEQERQARGSSPAGILPSVPATGAPSEQQPSTPPAQQPNK
ncbi:MAG: preprotein translocase subunit SecG [candidate division KSB1 bacterium]|nr:preprotein translocase subunit SecG [candidate division KSB1 bacterium]MDZ7367404.1 preprotein translocase subunit SecG [candidate division KSB1 bacterium]MDZ7405491.1 preprotein translocase subunit SecG [candidate division KSB1 bacterium]